MKPGSPKGPAVRRSRPGRGEEHHLVNRSLQDVVYLEVGDRSAGDRVIYPDDDLKAELGADGRRGFARKDGTAYQEK